MKEKLQKGFNKIKEAAKEAGASSRLISLWVDVDYTTVSRWSSNLHQPNEENLNQIGELLQKDNRDLIEPQGRQDTGLAKELELELRRLHQTENMPYEIEKFDPKKGTKVKVNNPELISKLKEFAAKHESNQNNK